MSIIHILTGECLLLLVEEIQRLVGDATFPVDWRFLCAVCTTDSLGASVRRLSLGRAVTLDLKAVATVLI